jgi:hypothetical protein
MVQAAAGSQSYLSVPFKPKKQEKDSAVPSLQVTENFCNKTTLLSFHSLTSPAHGLSMEARSLKSELGIQVAPSYSVC